VRIVEETRIAYLNRAGSCHAHTPRLDPDCADCKSALSQLIATERAESRGLYAVPAVAEPKQPIVPLVDHPVGHHEDGSFTMCPEVYQKFLLVLKYQLWIDHDSVDELADELYLRQRWAVELYT